MLESLGTLVRGSASFIHLKLPSEKRVEFTFEIPVYSKQALYFRGTVLHTNEAGFVSLGRIKVSHDGCRWHLAPHKLNRWFMFNHLVHKDTLRVVSKRGTTRLYL